MQPHTCITCGAQGTLQPRQRPLTLKRRPKFGFLWIVATVLTCGFALLLWLVWPRHRETVGVDRYAVCSACGAEQPG